MCPADPPPRGTPTNNRLLACLLQHRLDTNKHRKRSNLNLSDLKLSDKDVLALSYLTPGLSRRIQKQLLAQLAAASASTLSVEEAADRKSPPSRSNSQRYSLSRENSSSLTRSLETPKYMSRSSSSSFRRPECKSLYTPRPEESNYYLKEKKERELETQLVLKEIRDKRKSSLRQRSLSRERAIQPQQDDFLKNISDNIKSFENSSIHDYVNVPKLKSDVSLTNDVGFKSDVPKVEVATKDVVKKSDVGSKKNSASKKSSPSKIARPKSYPCKPETERPEASASKSESKKKHLFQTIEKKIKSFSSNGVPKSNIENTINRLREQSLPKDVDRCATESGLIKRAVSVDDFTSFDKEPKSSRKSVTKILNLFKKYEAKDGEKEKTGKSNKSKKPKKGGEEAAKKSKEKNNKEKSAEDLPAVVEKPKVSKLPRRSLNLDSSSTLPHNEHKTNGYSKPDRSALKLDLNLDTPTSSSSFFMSPSEDTDSTYNDSWSMCSDHHSPVSPQTHPYSADENESVSDRIRRKSFYLRFNEKKRHKKSSYKDLDLFRYLNNRRSGYGADELRPGRYSLMVPPDQDYDFYNSTRNSCVRNSHCSPPSGGSFRVPSNSNSCEDDSSLVAGNSRTYQPSRHRKKSVSPRN